MAQQMFIGTIKKVCETRTLKSGAQTRQFWAEEKEGGFGKNKYPNVLSFEVFTSKNGPSERFSNVGDLDAIKPGQLVRFAYEPKGSIWKNPKTNQETCFVKLSVVNKIELLSSKRGGNDANAASQNSPDQSGDLDDVDAGSDGMPF